MTLLQHHYIALLLIHKYKEIPNEIWKIIMREAIENIINMTVSSNLNTKLDIRKLVSVFKLDSVFKYIEHNCDRKPKRGKKFPIDYLRVYLSKNKTGRTIKICDNGNISLTGFKNDEDIKYIFNYFVTKIKNIEKNELKSILTNIDFKPNKYKYNLVKTKFYCNYINNYNVIDEIQKLVTDEGHELSNFTGTSVFIVKYKYYYNKEELKETKIHIIKNSNQIIIIGKNINQVKETYKFINKILNKVLLNKIKKNKSKIYNKIIK